jgi:hypothetical protein
LGNQGLTDSGDAYSEANDVRAGEAYADKGLSSNVGLAEISYGTAFDNVGGKRDPLLCGDPVPEKCVYLHYPPLPELMVGVSTKLFGKGRLFSYRIIPLLLGLLSLGALGAALYRAIGPVRAAVVMWLLGAIPMTSNMMHVFALHSYVTAFYFLEVAVVLVAATHPPSRKDLYALGAVAFLQGWTSFDYALHLALTPLAVFMALGRLHAPEHRRRVLVLTSVAAGAYALAMVLHFVQVAVYLGGVKAMLANFAASGSTRVQGPTWVVPPVSGATGIILYYFANLLPDKKFYDGNFIAFLATAIALLWPRTTSARIGKLGVLRLRTTLLQLVSFLLMVAIPCGWLVVMQQHSSIHGHFLPRNFTCTLLWGYLLVMQALSFDKAAASVQRVEEPSEQLRASEPVRISGAGA